MSESPEQIAREAAHAFFVFRAKVAQTEEQLEKDILSAIERATEGDQLKRIADLLESIIDKEKGTLRLVDVERGNVYKTHLGGNLSAAQPQKEGDAPCIEEYVIGDKGEMSVRVPASAAERSEQQEWTWTQGQLENSGSILEGAKVIVSGLPLRAKPIVIARNAALASERKTNIDAVTMACRILREEHKKELVAERQRNPPYETVCETLRLLETFHEPGESNCLIDLAKKVVSQLLSAQAAIENINKLTLDYVRADLALQQIRIWSHDVDLSLLHQHDANLRAQWEKEHGHSK